MSSSSIKSAVVNLLDELPDDCTWDDVAYAIHIRQKIAAGLKDADVGRFIEHDDVFREYHLDEDPVDETGKR